MHIKQKAIYDLGEVDGADDMYVLHDLKENGKALYQLFAKYNLI